MSLGFMTPSQATNIPAFAGLERRPRYLSLEIRSNCRPRRGCDNACAIFRYLNLLQPLVREHSAEVRRGLQWLTMSASYKYNTSRNDASSGGPPQHRVQDGAQRKGSPQSQMAVTAKDSAIS